MLDDSAINFSFSFLLETGLIMYRSPIVLGVGGWVGSQVTKEWTTTLIEGLGKATLLIRRVKE